MMTRVVAGNYSSGSGESPTDYLKRMVLQLVAELGKQV